MDEHDIPTPALFARKQVYGYLRQSVQAQHDGDIDEAADLLSQARARAEASVHYERAVTAAVADLRKIQREIDRCADEAASDSVVPDAHLQRALRQAQQRLAILLMTRP